MTRKISEMLTNTLMLSGAVSHEKQEVIIFGLELLISSIIGILIIIAISIIAGVPLLWIAFLLSFIPLRTTAGGYHALTHTGCNITFAITYIICVVLCKYVMMPKITFVLISAISTIMILLFSPVEAKNKPLNSERKKKNRLRSIVIITLFTVLSILIWLATVNHINIQMFYLGVFAATVSQIAALIINCKGENINESKT